MATRAELTYLCGIIVLSSCPIPSSHQRGVLSRVQWPVAQHAMRLMSYSSQLCLGLGRSKQTAFPASPQDSGCDTSGHGPKGVPRFPGQGIEGLAMGTLLGLSPAASFGVF